MVNFDPAHKFDELINTKQLFLSCDWGTSSFRLRLVAVPELHILGEVSDSTGIASTYELWKQEGKDLSQQLDFYQKIIKRNIENLEQKLEISLANAPLILSGMASSSIGMKELPYKELPFYLDGSDLLTDTVPGSEIFPYHTIIVSGVRSLDDVMRGEEIQLVGSMAGDIASEMVFILPGTHSKHILTKHGKATELKTYMTGELFDLLCTKSILAASLEKGSSFADQNNQEAFKNGVKDSIDHNPLHAFFLVRTNQLFRKLSKTENYYYLSGLLIGLELNELVKKQVSAITLVSNKELNTLYRRALEQLNLTQNLRTIDLEEAVIKGHYQIYLRYASV